MIEKLNLPQHIQETILNAYQRKPGYYSHQAQIAYSGDIPEFAINKRSPFDRAVILCCCLASFYGKYKAAGLPDSIIGDTFSDISLRLRLYEKKCGKIGLSKEDVIWLRHIFLCEIFQIGSLQYHKFNMLYLDKEGIGEDYMTYAQKPVLQGTPVWNIHVPRGTDLSPGAVSKSMEIAAKLLPEVFPAHNAEYFLCYSWLLYPDLKKLLSEKSNISKFSELFTVIGSVQDPSEAIACIYGKHHPRKAGYPQHTALQCAALGHFSQLGYGCGLRKMDNT